VPIERILQMRNCGVFRDFSWPTDLSDFGRYNLLYGWNGAGKTTLSRLFRSLELRRSPTVGEAVLRISGIDVAGNEFPFSTFPIRVFNRDFIHESVFPIGGGDVPPIFVVGKDSVDKQKDVDRLKAERQTKENERDVARTRKTQAERDLERHCIDRARVIKDTLQKTGSAYNNYNRTDYQVGAQRMAADGDAVSHRLRESQREVFLAQHLATPKPPVSTISYRLPDFQSLADQVSVLLGTTVVSAAIQVLKDNSALAEWVRHGLGLHKEYTSDKCLFCEQPLPLDRLGQLEAHFNAEYERLLQRIDEQIRALEAVEKQATVAVVPNRAELYDDLAVDFDAALQTFRESADVVRRYVVELVEDLKRKKTEPFAVLSLIAVPPTADPTVVDRLNDVIRRHNHACEDFARRVNEARERLAKDMIAESLDDFIRFREAVQDAAKGIGPIEAEIS
jgi:wobble nucleotide-excising tRNase